MMDMGHLYHDAVYGDPILALDVKEQLRTREINACEEMNLARKSQIYDRAKDLCEKTANQEKWRVGQTINVILERSPHLERSLALEKARLEMLHNIFVRRQAAKKAKEEGSTYTYATTTASPISRSTMSSRRPDTRKGRSALKGIGRRRRQERGKTKKRRMKEDGPILNTDFNLERHLPKTSLYSKRNEHAVKTLAKLSWQMETRKRDHRRFQENLVRFSKPMMDRARMVLRGRPDIDVEQFLKEFEDFLNPQEKSNCKVTHRKSNGKRVLENSVFSDEPSQGTLVQQNECQDFSALNTAENTCKDSHETLLLHDLSTLSNEQNSLSKTKNDSLAQELPLRLQNLALDSCGNRQSNYHGNDSKSENLLASRSNNRPISDRENSFYLPAIVATKSDVMNLKSRPGSSATADQTVGTSIQGENLKVTFFPEKRGSMQELIDVNNNKYQTNDCILKTSITNPGIAKSSSDFRVKKPLGDPSRLAFVTKIYHNDESLPTETEGLGENTGGVTGKSDHFIRNKNLSADSSLQRNNLAGNNIGSEKSTGPTSSSPSTVLSQTIEEDEVISEQNNQGTESTVLSSPSHSNNQQYLRGADGSNHHAFPCNLHTLPSLFNYGMASSTNPSISSGFFSVSGEQPRTGRNQSPRRNKPDFVDLLSTSKRHFLKKSNASVSERSNPDRLDTCLPDKILFKENDLYQKSVDRGKKNVPSSPTSHNSNHSNIIPLNPDKHTFLPNLIRKQNHKDVQVTNVSNGGKNHDDSKEKGSPDDEGYTLTCTIGLPKMWKQSMDKKKDPRAEPEVSAAAIARRHRRGRMNSQSMF